MHTNTVCLHSGRLLRRSSAPPAASPAFPRHALVVTDEGPIRELCCRMFERAGLTADGVESGETAWAALQAVKYDLLLTEACMSRSSGMDLVRRMRAAGLAQPVILMSGDEDGPDGPEAADLGQVGTLKKPFSLYQLMVRADSLLPSRAELAGLRPMPALRM